MIILKWHNDGGLIFHWRMHFQRCLKNGQHMITTVKKKMTHEDHEESFAGALTPEHLEGNKETNEARKHKQAYVRCVRMSVRTCVCSVLRISLHN